MELNGALNGALLLLRAVGTGAGLEGSLQQPWWNFVLLFPSAADASGEERPSLSEPALQAG